VFRFNRAKKLRIRADYHERKASTPEFIFSVASERFDKLNFNLKFSNETTNSMLCQEVDYVLPRRKGWGKPISVARLRNLKKNRAKVEYRERNRRSGRAGLFEIAAV